MPGWTPSSVAVNRAVTFLLVCGRFVIFRAPSLGVAGEVLSSMAGLTGWTRRAARGAHAGINFALLMAGLLVFVHAAPNAWQIGLRPRVWQGVASGIAAGARRDDDRPTHPFLYFQF